jgi:hypothetical protein
MVCFEVYRNNVRLCRAGIGELGVLTAILTWVSHHPETLARWKSQGIEETEPTRLEFTGNGLGGKGDADAGEHLKWVGTDVSTGDEIRIRIVDAPDADPPLRRYSDEPGFIKQKKKEYVRETAKEFGWDVNEERM